MRARGVLRKLVNVAGRKPDVNFLRYGEKKGESERERERERAGEPIKKNSR